MPDQNVVYLSYAMTPQIPTYGEVNTSLQIEPRKSIKNGDSSNSYFLGIENHWGTHIDAPKHFFDDGHEIADYPASTWEFLAPQVVSVAPSENLLVGPELFEGKIKSDTDFLIIKTGYYKFRGQERYSFENPGLHSELGTFLRKEFPKIRAVGLDSISISSRTNREEGRKAHKTFLSPQESGKPILLVEDMDLSQASEKLKRVVVLPLRVQSIDSAPCTVIGFYK